MRFQRERYSEALVTEMRPLWVKHYQETVTCHYGVLDPDLLTYSKMDELGFLRIYTIRLEEGIVENELVGYQIFILTYHPHSKRSYQANQDILYLDKSIRKGSTASRFIRWCSEELRQEKIDIIHQHVPAYSEFGRVLEHQGFKLEDKTYSKCLQGVA